VNNPDDYPFAAHIRVRFADTDAQGVAHNSNYFIWFEVARVELRDEGIESLVLESHAHFKSPAFFDDRLLVHARCHAVRGARFRFDYVVERDGTLLADGWTLHGTVDAKTLRPTRTPGWLSASLLSASSPSAAS
jgi:acyl-CoA thioester hydrolase